MADSAATHLHRVENDEENAGAVAEADAVLDLGA